MAKGQCTRRTTYLSIQISITQKCSQGLMDFPQRNKQYAFFAKLSIDQLNNACTINKTVTISCLVMMRKGNVIFLLSTNVP